ncbi:MAG: RNA pseudouridine synthase [Colwellia sp.]
MPVDENCSKTQNETLGKYQQKFAWHIKVLDQEITPQKEQNTNKITAIALLTTHAQQQKSQLSNADLKKAISKGALWLTTSRNSKQTQRLRRVKKQLAIGDELHFYYDSAVLSTTVPKALLIADLIDYSVWYKPYGMLSQGSKWGDHCTIARFAQQNLVNERPAFIVHRLDRAATGLILIAHSKKAAQALSLMFEQHQLEKHYHIVVHGDHRQRPQPDIIERYIDDKKARSTFTCLSYDEIKKYSLIQVKIDSGRKHQIRKHAASINMPVVGDRLHGIADENEPLDLQLCAVSLRFICPVTKHERFFELPETLKPQLFQEIKLRL